EPVSKQKRVARCGYAFAHYAERINLCADRRPGGGAYNVVTRGNRRRPQLGLSLLLATGCGSHFARVAAIGLSRRSQIVAPMAPACHRWQPGANASNLWRAGRTPPRRVRNSLVIRLRKFQTSPHRQRRFQSISARRLWGDFGSYLAGRSCWTQAGGPGLGSDRPVDEIPGVKLAETRRRNLGSARRTKTVYAFKNDGLGGV